MRFHPFPALLAISLAAGCGATPSYDYAAFLEHPPASILVLPPLDESPEIDAVYGCLSTVSRPLAEMGYYVFPVGLVDRMMRDNGLPTPYEMHQVPLEKLREIFDPDAVLYLTVRDWGTGYKLLVSETTITVDGRLVDVKTGTQLWSGSETAVLSSGDSGGGLAGMLASALVNQVITSIDDPSRDVSRSAVGNLFGNRGRGLLLGPRHPEHGASLAGAAPQVE